MILIYFILFKPFTSLSSYFLPLTIAWGPGRRGGLGAAWFGSLLFLHFDKLFKLFKKLMRVLAGFYETLEITLEP